MESQESLKEDSVRDERQTRHWTEGERVWGRPLTARTVQFVRDCVSKTETDWESWIRKDGRVVECGRLEICYRACLYLGFESPSFRQFFAFLSLSFWEKRDPSKSLCTTPNLAPCRRESVGEASFLRMQESLWKRCHSREGGNLVKGALP